MTKDCPTDDITVVPPDGVIGRRRLLRGGTILAGAAIGAAAIALDPGAAHAADGDALLLGAANSAASTTTLTVGGEDGSAAPALALDNADGPALRLRALSGDWPGQLAVGEVAGTELGPVVGVDSLGGVTTTYLVTGIDLANVASPFAAEPRRVLDLRVPASRDAAVIRRSSSQALAADGKLRAGQWIDIAMAFTSPDYELSAVFANLTATGALTGGYASLYAPGVRPPTSSVNFGAKQTVANAAFVGTGSVLGFHAVRLYAQVEAWFVLDVTGGVTAGNVSTPLPEAGRAAGGRRLVVDRVRKALGRLTR